MTTLQRVLELGQIRSDALDERVAKHNQIGSHLPPEVNRRNQRTTDTRCKSSAKDRQMRGLFLWLLAALLLAGCDGSDRLSKEEYEQEVGAIMAQAEVEIDARAAYGALIIQDRERAAGAYEELLDGFREIGNQLAQVNPPEEIAQAHEDLVAVYRGVADSFEPIADAIKRGDFRAARKTYRGVVNSELNKRFETANEKLEELGYDVSDEREAASP